MILNRILPKFNLVFSVFIACASVTSAAVLIHANIKKLASSGASSGYRIGGSGSSSNEAQKAFSGGKAYGWDFQSHRASSISNTPEILIYGSGSLDGNPFDRYAFSMPPLEFTTLTSPDFYTHPEIDLPFLEEVKPHASISPETAYTEKPDLNITESPHRTTQSQTTDTPSQASNTLTTEQAATAAASEESFASSIMPDMTSHFQHAVETFQNASQAHPIAIKRVQAPEPQFLIETLLPELQRAEVIVTEVAPNSITAETATTARSENFASFILPNMAPHFQQATETIEPIPQTHPIAIATSKAPRPNPIIEEQLLQPQRAEVLNVKIFSSDAAQGFERLSLESDTSGALELSDVDFSGDICNASNFSDGSVGSVSDFFEAPKLSTPILSRLLDALRLIYSTYTDSMGVSTLLRSFSTDDLRELPDSSIPNVSDFSDGPELLFPASSLLDALLSPTRQAFKTNRPALRRSLSASSLPTFPERRTPPRLKPGGLETLLDELTRLDELGSDAHMTAVPDSLRLAPGELENLLGELEQLDELGSDAHSMTEFSAASSSLLPKNDWLSDTEDLDLGSLFAEHSDIEENNEWTSAVPPKAHAIKLLKVGSELLEFFRVHGQDWSGRSAHKSLLQNLVHPDLLQRVKRAEPDLTQTEEITTVFSPTSTTLIMSPSPARDYFSEATMRYALFGERPAVTAAASPTSTALIMSPPRVPQIIKGINMAHGALLPHQALWMEAEAASTAVKDAVYSLMQAPIFGLNRLLRPQTNMRLNGFSNWAMPLAGLNIQRNPMLLGLNAALRASGVDIFQQQLPKPRLSQIETLPTTPYSPTSTALIVSPPRVPPIIKGINMAHGALLPHQALWMEAEAASAVVIGALSSLMQTPFFGLGRVLRPQTNIWLRDVPNWAMPLVGLNIQRNPMILGINAALHAYKKAQVQQKWWETAPNPFSAWTTRSLAQLNAEDTTPFAQENSVPKKEGTPSPVRAAKRSLTDALEGLADTSSPKRILLTPMRHALITAARDVVTEVSELASPTRKKPLRRKPAKYAAGELPSTPVIFHPLMPSGENGSTSPIFNQDKDDVTQPAAAPQPQKPSVQQPAKPKPLQPVNYVRPKPRIVSRLFGRVEKDLPTPPPVDIEMVQLGSGEDQENSPVISPSPSKHPRGVGKIQQQQGASKPPSSAKQRRALGIPRRLDLENFVDTISQ